MGGWSAAVVISGDGDGLARGVLRYEPKLVVERLAGGKGFGGYILLGFGGLWFGRGWLRAALD
jgi:hypothetical protein